jgi:hypothetical protein
MRKSFLGKLGAWFAREDVRRILTATVLVASIALYGVIFYIGRRPAPPPASAVPLFLRLHPERLLACAATVFAMFTVVRRLETDRPILEPLAWIFLASVIHLLSLAVEFHWI